MEILEFIDLSVGNWFSQRTSYDLGKNQTENSKSDLAIARLLATDPTVTKLTQAYPLDSQTTVGGIKVSWDNSVDWGKPKQTGSIILILIPNQDNPQQGKLVQAHGKTLDSLVGGEYRIGSDEAIQLTMENNDWQITERIWFASENLRMRTSMITTKAGLSLTAFYSEIRKISKS